MRMWLMCFKNENIPTDFYLHCCKHENALLIFKLDEDQLNK